MPVPAVVWTSEKVADFGREPLGGEIAQAGIIGGHEIGAHDNTLTAPTMKEGMPMAR
jgi:hypothetical protein